jgi:putative transposase
LRFHFVHQHRELWPIDLQCRILEVSRQGYYQWLDQTPSARAEKQQAIVSQIKRIHALHRHDVYGSPRMHKEILKQEIQCCENTVARLMKQAGIRARRSKKYRVTTTDSKHDLPIAPNRLNQRFTCSNMNRVWLTDFTYIPLKEGFTYLCSVQDLFSRRIVGWATGQSIDAQLALNAINQAIALRQPEDGLVVHSDRGSQFASEAYRSRLSECRFLQSMSRKGNCYDNAPMESFFKSFKVEEVRHQHYDSHEQAVRAVIDYIERFYNSIRSHSSLGFVSPVQFEKLKLLEINQSV